MNPAVRFLLGFEGVTDADAVAIDKAIPAAERLNDVMIELDPIIRKIWPDVLKIFTILQRAYPDGIAVLPVARRILQLVKGT